jgi:8-oxo-dGTP diphosphatase
MAFDHKKILDTCYRTLQKKVQEEPIIFNLMENKFSLRELQNIYEAILNIRLDRRNFRKKLFTTALLTDLDEFEKDVPHRPGKLYSFNHERYAKIRRKTFVGIDF